MQPTPGISQTPVQAGDEFDVPVIVRRSLPLDPPRRPSRGVIDDGDKLLVAGSVPADGCYKVSTTWREVLHAALSVGRDVTPWLTQTPQLAAREILARQSPLMAYLHRVPTKAGYTLAANDVYLRGTESSARGAFGYRLGMTMAEWLCWGRLGMSHSLHAETSTPEGTDPHGWVQLASKPDLLGRHTSHPHQWIIEAKGSRRLGQPALRKGAQQLDLAGTLDAPYRKLLVGTSIEHRLFLTLDLEDDEFSTFESEPTVLVEPDLLDDDIALYYQTRASMLIYLLLAGSPPAELTVRPVGRNVNTREREVGASAVTLLDRDESTAALRRDTQGIRSARRIRDAGGIDMLVTRVPGTDIEVGLSRRLFSACRELVPQQRAMALAAADEAAQHQLDATLPPIDILQRYEPPVAEAEVHQRDTYRPEPEAWRTEAFERRLREEERYLYRQAEFERWQMLLEQSRRGFAIGADASWQQLAEVEPEISIGPRTPMLESATPDVYIAIAPGAVP